jgi:hypothetical protein
MRVIAHWFAITSSLVVFGLMPLAASATQKTITLTNTGAIPTAMGVAELTIRHAESLDVSADGLSPFAVYLVKVDGKLVGALNTDGTGSVDAAWSTDAQGKVLALPSSVPAFMHLIEVMNESGAVVLTGMFQ